jgi:protein disulfide-isomerase-like protein
MHSLHWTITLCALSLSQKVTGGVGQQDGEPVLEPGGPSWLAQVSGSAGHDIQMAQLPEGESFVEELTADSFDEFILENPVTMVQFYAPYCGHCKAMAPDYEKAAWILDDKDIPIARVDAIAERDLAQRFGVKGFPTIKVFSGEQAADPEDYHGPKDAQAFIDHMRKTKDPKYVSDVPANHAWQGSDANIYHMQVSTWEDFRNEHPRVLAIFYAPWCSHSQRLMPLWASASENIDNHTVMAAVNCMRQDSEPLCRKYVIEGFPEILYFNTSDAEGVKPDRVPLTRLGIKRFSNLEIDPDWIPTDRDVGEFVSETLWNGEDSENGNVAHLDDDHFEWYRAKHEHMFVLYYIGDSDGNVTKKAKTEIATASKNFPPNFGIAAVDCKQEQTQLCTTAQLEGYPTLRYMTPRQGLSAEAMLDPLTAGGLGLHINLNTGLSAESLVAFAYEKAEAQVRDQANSATQAAKDMPDGDTSELDLSSLKMKALKKLLRERGQECAGCTDRSEFEARVRDTIHLPKVAKAKSGRKKKPRPKYHFDKDGLDSDEVNEALFKAVREGTSAEVNELLTDWSAKVDAYDTIYKNNRPLHMIAMRNDTSGVDGVLDILEIGRVLINHGAMIDAENKDDSTALHLAVLDVHLDVADLLINSNATVDAQNYWGVTPLHYAANRGVLSAVRMLLEAGADPFVTSTAGKTPLDFATGRGLSEVEQELQSAMDAKADSMLADL